MLEDKGVRNARFLLYFPSAYSPSALLLVSYLLLCHLLRSLSVMEMDAIGAEPDSADAIAERAEEAARVRSGKPTGGTCERV